MTALPAGQAEPFYVDEFSTLYLGDALDVLPTLPRDCAGLLIADPPYGVDWQSRRRVARPGFDRIVGDESTDTARAILAEALPVLRNRRHLYVFGPSNLVDGLPIGATSELIWDRLAKGSGNLASPWGPSHDRITFATQVRYGQRTRETAGGHLSARLRRGSVIAVPRPGGKRTDHPTQKPVALIRQLIESSSLLGETVLDPCAGTGSTGVAAVLEGRSALLVECKEEYAARAVEKLASAAQVRRAAEAFA